MDNTKIKFFLYSIFFLVFIIKYNIKNNNFPIKNIINIKLNILKLLDQYLVLNYENKDIINIKFFSLNDIKYYFSFKFNIVKVQYNIGFYDINRNLILPSDLALYNKLHFSCHFEQNKKNITIESIPNIFKNKYFSCIELFNINEDARFGIKIFQIKEALNYTTFYLFNEKIINYENLLCHYDKFFSSFFINQEYISLINNFSYIKNNDSLKFKKSFAKYPYSTLKKNTVLSDNKWYFRNIYNHYFCFCIGESCLNNGITQKCKYYFYLYILDNNKNIYLKTHYLFVDFIFAELSSDDVYPIFKRMDELQFPVHYITEHLDIYNKHCVINKQCFKIIFVDKNNYTMNGDFLENYLNLFLKLKVVVSGRSQGFNYCTNLFYNLDYITYIGVGHGVSFLKYFLYKDDETYGRKQNDKILIPPSHKFISIACKYGWNKKNIIGMNLPKWDKYNDYNIYSLNFNQTIRNNSIFMMFTWRDLKRHKEISIHYFKNILSIIQDNILNNALKNNNIILYFSFHHLLKNYINNYKKKLEINQYIHIINNNDISECLFKTNLVVTDFSSIIFDFMYQRKPFIIYVPDANDNQIENIYIRNYYELIQSLKNETNEFENKFFSINEAIEKILYYINNKFILDQKLKIFYDSFNLTKKNYTDEFINYIINL